MQSKDYDLFRDLMAGMAEVYAKELSTTLLDAYWLALKSWPFSEFADACAILMQGCKFMPRPSEFYDLRKTAVTPACEWWRQAVAIARNGSYRAGERVADESAHQAIEAMGGYAAIGRCEEEKLHFFERRFEENFDRFMERELLLAPPKLKAIQ